MSAGLWDVIVIGAGPAGLNAALVLGRCRRKVLLFDDGKSRNAASRALHGFLTRDGIPPAELRRIGREQLAPYDSVSVMEASVVDAAGKIMPFRYRQTMTRYSSRGSYCWQRASGQIPTL